eukprot:COSAG03_NODE_166_length_11291_cov_15.762866_7_plen_108_part_00
MLLAAYLDLHTHHSRQVAGGGQLRPSPLESVHQSLVLECKRLLRADLLEPVGDLRALVLRERQEFLVHAAFDFIREVRLRPHRGNVRLVAAETAPDWEEILAESPNA